MCGARVFLSCLFGSSLHIGSSWATGHFSAAYSAVHPALYRPGTGRFSARQFTQPGPAARSRRFQLPIRQFHGALAAGALTVFLQLPEHVEPRLTSGRWQHHHGKRHVMQSSQHVCGSFLVSSSGQTPASSAQPAALNCQRRGGYKATAFSGSFTTCSSTPCSPASLAAVSPV